jgi:hypothetical protein
MRAPAVPVVEFGDQAGVDGSSPVPPYTTSAAAPTARRLQQLAESRWPGEAI